MIKKIKHPEGPNLSPRALVQFKGQRNIAHRKKNIFYTTKKSRKKENI